MPLSGMDPSCAPVSVAVTVAVSESVSVAVTVSLSEAVTVAV